MKNNNEFTSNRIDSILNTISNILPYLMLIANVTCIHSQQYLVSLVFIFNREITPQNTF